MRVCFFSFVRWRFISGNCVTFNSWSGYYAEKMANNSNGMVIAKAKAASSTSRTPATQPLKEKQNLQATPSPQSKHSSKEETSPPRETLFSPNKNREIIEANRSRANVVSLHLDKISDEQSSARTMSKSKEKHLPETIRSTGATREAATEIKENHYKNYSGRHQTSSCKPTASGAAQSMQYATESLNELSSKLTRPCSVKLVRLTDAQLSEQNKKSKKSTHSASSGEETSGMSVMSGMLSFMRTMKSSSSKSVQISPRKSSADSRMATPTPTISGNTSRKTKLQPTCGWFEKGQTKSLTPSCKHASSAGANSFPPVKSTPRKSLPAKLAPSTSHTSTTAAPTARKLPILPLPALPWLNLLEARKQTSSMKSTPPSVLTQSNPTSINAAKSTPQSVGRHSINQSVATSAAKKTTPKLPRPQLRPLPSPHWLLHVLLTPKPAQTQDRLSDLSDDE